MAFADVGSGGTGIKSASSSTMSVSLTSDVSLSNSRFCLLSVTSDNIATTDGDSNNHSSVTGGVGNWTKLGEYTNGNGAAAAGTTTSVWLFIPTGANATATFTVTFSAALVDACAQIRRFTWDTTKGIRQTTEASVVNNGVDASNGFGSVSYSGLTSLSRLYFRGLGKEANSTTALTATTNFTAGSTVRSRNNAAAQLSRSEYRINTSTGETSNPTLAVSGDTSAVFVALEEYALAANLQPSLFTNSQTFFAPTVAPGPVDLTPSLVSDGETFYAATVAQPAGTQDLTPSLYTNSNSFPAATVTTSYTLTANLFTDDDTIHSPTVAPGAVNLTPGLITNSQSFPAPTVLSVSTLVPSLVDLGNSFYAATVGAGPVDLAPALISNSQTVYSATVALDGGSQDLAPELFTNSLTVPAATVTPGPVEILPPLVDLGNTFYGSTVVSISFLYPTMFDNTDSNCPEPPPPTVIITGYSSEPIWRGGFLNPYTQRNVV